MLLMIGGCLMMLEPLLRARPALESIMPITYVLGEAFSAEPYLPIEMRQLIARIH